jgi:hypothetical protein
MGRPVLILPNLPTGAGAPRNPGVPGVVVSENEYDGGMASGDGNMSQITQHVDSATSRVMVFGFDWRNGQIVVEAGKGVRNRF